VAEVSVDLACDCGGVRLHLASIPNEATDCNCGICRRYGALWAYAAPRDVATTSAGTDVYLRGDRLIAFHRCRTCGCVTHWRAVDPDRDRMGVNMRLAPPDLVAALRIRRLDGADTWTFLDE